MRPPDHLSQSLDSFDNLVANHRSKTYRYLARLCRNNHDAEDLVQETFVRLWNKRDQYRGDGRLSGFVRKVAYRTFLNSRRRRNVPSRNWTLHGASADSHADPAKACAAQDDHEYVARKIHEIVSELPESLREPFIRVHLRGMSAREVALSLGITAKAVSHRVQRARACLHARLQQCLTERN